MTPKTQYHAVAVKFSAVVLAFLYLAQVLGTVRSAELQIGVLLEERDDRLVVVKAYSGEAADRAGVEAGDYILLLNGEVARSFAEYDRLAVNFKKGEAIQIVLERGSESIEVEFVPGGSVDWTTEILYGIEVLCLIGLAFLTASRPDNLRACVLGWFAISLGLELAIPDIIVGQPNLVILCTTFLYLLTGIQMALELHLASLIPDRQPWIEKRPWIVPGFYIVGVGLGSFASFTFLLEELATDTVPAFASELARILLMDVGIRVWAVSVLAILAVAFFRHPDPQGRSQAGLVLLGDIPWAIYALAIPIPGTLDSVLYEQLDRFLPLILLCYPVAIFVAIFRYHLFDIEFVVRRSMVYTILTSSLLLVFYAALGAGGALSSQLLNSERNSIWVVSAATLILGLLFLPLRRWIQGFIDRRIYPGRLELRQKLIQIAAALPSLGRLQLMGDHLVAELASSFSVRPVYLLLTDPGSDVLLPLASFSGVDDFAEDKLLLSLDDPAMGAVMKANQPLRIAELMRSHPEFARRLHSTGASVIVPLKTQNSVVGLVLLGSNEEDQPLRAEEFDLLSLLAHHVASVFENVRLFQSATYEGLTGLFRREAIVDLLEREITRAQRYDRPLSIGLADIDHFKRVNDRYGHLAGDIALRHTADRLKSSLRSTDLIGRYGGEEFLMVFPETHLETAARLAEKLRSRVEENEFQLGTSEVMGNLTISIGVAALSADQQADSTSISVLLNEADQALYRAKRLGRNRVDPAASEPNLSKQEIRDQD